MLAAANHEAVVGMGEVARVDQHRGVEQLAAVVALVAARALESAEVALALDVAIGQKAILRLTVEQRLLLAVEVIALQQQRKNVLCDAVMGLGVGVGEEVVANAQLLLRTQEATVIVLKDGFSGQSALVGLD